MEVLARDRMGNPTEEKDFNGNITEKEYNALNLVKKVTDPLGKTTETTYNKTGKVKTVKNRRDYTTTYDYDALDREIRVTDARDQTVETTYNKVGNVKTVKDKRGIITERSLWDWFMDIKEGKENRRQMTIVLENDQHIAQITWHLVDCFPIRWSGPTLDATSNEFGFEEVEICCEDIHLDTWETK